MTSSLLLELGVPFLRTPSGLRVEAQALNGLRLWCRHFSYVTVCAVELPPNETEATTIVWADPGELLAGGGLTLEPLPWGYHPFDHARLRNSVARRFKGLIARHDYLCFSNLGAFGAWGNIAAAEARRQGRPYSLWFDWVLHEMSKTEGDSLLRKLKVELFRALVRHNTFKAIRSCDLGLFHGQTVFDAYAPLCRQPALVHDVHVHPEDGIGDKELATKLGSLDDQATVRFGYVGRVHPMKAPFQWIDAIAEVVAKVGPDRVIATWLGDGPLLDEARDRVSEMGLDHSIRFVGFVADRAELLAFIRHQNVMPFCHVTPESPRCLIEALISGTPIVGYDSAYARGLVADRGGATLSPVGDFHTLATHLIHLVNDRSALRRLTLQAATARGIYNDEAVFSHRSNLIKQYLTR